MSSAVRIAYQTVGSTTGVREFTVEISSPSRDETGLWKCAVTVSSISCLGHQSDYSVVETAASSMRALGAALLTADSIVQFNARIARLKLDDDGHDFVSEHHLAVPMEAFSQEVDSLPYLINAANVLAECGKEAALLLAKVAKSND